MQREHGGEQVGALGKSPDGAAPQSRSFADAREERERGIEPQMTAKSEAFGVAPDGGFP